MKAVCFISDLQGLFKIFHFYDARRSGHCFCLSLVRFFLDTLYACLNKSFQIMLCNNFDDVYIILLSYQDFQVPSQKKNKVISFKKNFVTFMSENLFLFMFVCSHILTWWTA